MLTYRFAPHSTYDGTPVYRTTDEESQWRERDPITRMRALLVNKGLWETSQEDDMRAGISADLERSSTSSRPGPRCRAATRPGSCSPGLRPR